MLLGQLKQLYFLLKSATIALVLNEKPITCCIRNADIKTPTVESSNTLIFTFFNTFKLISLPPIYNIKADPKCKYKLIFDLILANINKF